MMINRVSKLISTCLKVSLFIILGLGYSSGNLLASSQSCTEWVNTNKSVHTKSKPKQHSSDKKSSKATRVKFARGAYSGIVTGKLKDFNSEQSYVIGVGKGQALSIKQIDRQGSQYVSVYVTAPNGEDVNDMDLSCHSNANVSPTVAGDYTIKVIECLKADPWEGRYSLKVTIK